MSVNYSKITGDREIKTKAKAVAVPNNCRLTSGKTKTMLKSGPNDIHTSGTKEGERRHEQEERQEKKGKKDRR